MSEWKKVKLGEVCDTQYGFTASTLQQNTGTRFLRITDIVPQLIDWNSVPYCQIQEKDREKYLLHKGDIVVARTGATVGYAKYIKKDVPAVFASYLVRLLVNSKDVDKHYVGLCVESNLFKEYIQSISNGSAQPNANAQMISSFEIPLPPLSTQHRIATILSRYDSLIENYQKQIKLLEEAAQRLYKEWFIDLHFPGHEDTNIIDGVPEGWEDTNVNGIVTFHRGYDLTHSEMIDGKYPVIGSTSIIGTHKDYKIKGPGIVTGRSGSLGKFQLIQSDFWPHNTTLYISDFKGHDVYYIYCMLNRLDFASLNNGGAIPTLNRNVLSNISVLEPDCKVQKEFTKIVTPMFVKIENIQSQLRLLTEARDRLLPKLMNGAIEV